MNEIVMPKLSDTMIEGRVVSWKKRVGEKVSRGDVLAEVETDKANMELEAFASGVLLEIKVQAGELASVGTVIAVIGKPEEKGATPAQPAEGGAAKPEPSGGVPEAEPATAPKAAEPAASGNVASRGEPSAAGEAGQGKPMQEEARQGGLPAQESPETAEAESTGITAGKGETQAPSATVEPGAGEAQTPVVPARQGSAVKAHVPPAPAETASGGGEARGVTESGVRAAPIVRRRARELGIDLSGLPGSGPDGRILLQDLERNEPAPEESGQTAAPVGQVAAGEGARPLSRVRAAIAKTVSESWRSIPHFSVTMEILMDEAEGVRRQLKQSGHAVTLNDMVVKGVALSLLRFQQLNASFAADGVQQHSEINIGIAVGLPEGVLVPVIVGCQRLSLLEISQAGRKLVERARQGALGEREMSGGTFSVSNLGMYGVSQFSAVIYPSQAGVLAVGASMDRAVVRAGMPACAKIMQATLSADHRLVDGAYAAEFLQELKAILENPVRLLI